MARAKRHYLPGHIWHITHRCHKKEFLLKFTRDKRRWLQWLYQAKKRYGLTILNYIVTSNHIHLLVLDDCNRETIPKSMQLIAGRTGQEYNQRKNRRGAFWEDRYHATAVEDNEHLLRCLVYIDLYPVKLFENSCITHTFYKVKKMASSIRVTQKTSNKDFSNITKEKLSRQNQGAL